MPANRKQARPRRAVPLLQESVFLDRLCTRINNAHNISTANIYRSGTKIDRQDIAVNIGDPPHKATARQHLIPFFEAFQHGFMLSGTLLLGTDEQKIKDGQHGDKRNEIHQSAAFRSGSRRTHGVGDRSEHVSSLKGLWTVKQTGICRLGQRHLQTPHLSGRNDVWQAKTVVRLTANGTVPATSRHPRPKEADRPPALTVPKFRELPSTKETVNAGSATERCAPLPFFLQKTCIPEQMECKSSAGQPAGFSFRTVATDVCASAPVEEETPSAGKKSGSDTAPAAISPIKNEHVTREDACRQRLSPGMGTGEVMSGPADISEEIPAGAVPAVFRRPDFSQGARFCRTVFPNGP